MKQYTARSHWPDGHWTVPLAPLADESGNLPQEGQFVPQEVIDRLAAYEATGLLLKEIEAVKNNDVAFRTGPDMIEVGRDCHICGAFIPVFGSDDPTTICDECAKRLKDLLYPEEKESETCGEYSVTITGPSAGEDFTH